MNESPKWRLENVRKSTGETESVREFASPYLAECARRELDKAPDADQFRRRIVGPNPWPHL